MVNLQYPIGVYQKPSEITPEIISQKIEILSRFPELLQKTLENISLQELKTPYRPGGWNIAQVIHHCADSHLNAFIRTKWTITETQPTIKPYDEKLWANLPDATENFPISASLNMINGIHERWTHLLKNLDITSFEKAFFHPESEKLVTIAELVCIYAWHSMHHLAHIKLVTEKS